MPDAGIEAPNVPDFALAQWLFQVQFKQLERSGITAQSLIYSVTLSGALAAPLLLSGLPQGNVWGIAIASILLLYLLTLGLAVRACLRVVYTSEGDRAPESLGHYRHIATGFSSARDFADHVTKLSDRDQLHEVLNATYVVSTVLIRKADAMRRASYWCRACLALLGGAMVARAVGSLIGGL